MQREMALLERTLTTLVLRLPEFDMEPRKATIHLRTLFVKL